MAVVHNLKITGDLYS